ncbi:hypothetical protein PENSUB_7356 [Penicillium subrubescens]|uniref:Uncharacterized protein n=1 Tax=Penicillium subrubescens TaxID=1316194 RepID=A0A1Q5TMB6_9EURO|nr:hypothetical protein PENSUB_7356 [Penicillium subrubescens]
MQVQPPSPPIISFGYESLRGAAPGVVLRAIFCLVGVGAEDLIGEPGGGPCNLADLPFTWLHFRGPTTQLLNMD